MCFPISPPPGLITTPLASTLRPKAAHLRCPAHWGLSNNEIRKIAASHPSVLTTPAATTDALWGWLTGELGLDQVRHILHIAHFELSCTSYLTLI